MNEWVVMVFVPGRHRPGGLAAALGRHGVQFVEGFPSEALRTRYARRSGLAVTLAGFEAEVVRGRITLPESLAAALYEITADVGEPVEVAVLASGEDAPRVGPLSADAIGTPLSPGHRYVVAPPKPGTGEVPGRPEAEGWMVGARRAPAPAGPPRKSGGHP